MCNLISLLKSNLPLILQFRDNIYMYNHKIAVESRQTKQLHFLYIIKSSRYVPTYFLLSEYVHNE